MNSEEFIQIVSPGTDECRLAAEKLRKELNAYRIPKEVSRKRGIRRIKEVRERWLIVLCSHETPSDPGVQEAIDRFIRDGLFHHILTLLVKGTPETSFPRRLMFEELEDGTQIDREPLAANITAGRRRAMLRKLKTEKFRLLAPVLGVTFDDLMNRRQRARTRMLAAAAAAALTVAAVFLAYAFSKMTVINGQNAELSRQYTAAEEAHSNAEEEKDAAQASYLRTVAVMAENALNQGNTELALKLCLDKEADLGNVPELYSVFERSLRTLCGAGYVPVTDPESYRKSHPEESGAEPEDKTDTKPEREIVYPVPDGLDAKNKTASYDVILKMPEYGYYICEASVKLKNGDSVKCALVHFPEEPDKDFFLRDEEDSCFSPDYSSYTRAGKSRTVQNAYPLSGGRVLIGSGKRMFLADPPEGTVKQVSDTEYDYILDFRECGLILGKTSGGMDVYTREPFAFSRALEGVEDCVCEGNAGVLIGKSEDRLAAFDADTLQIVCTIDREDIDLDNFKWANINTVGASGGKRYLSYGWVVYDLNKGEKVVDFTDMRNGYSTMETPLISSEGYAFIPGINYKLRIWDLNRNELYQALQIIVPEGSASKRINYQLMGPADPESGTRNAAAFSANEIVYELREGIEVPEGPEQQAALADRLLFSRELTPEERNTWLMEE